MTIRRSLKLLLAQALSNQAINKTLFKSIYLSRFSEWCKRHPVGISTERKEMHSRAMKHIGTDNAVQYLEFGVYQGESLKWWCELMDNPDSEFVGFDCFEGLPEEWEGEKPKGHFTTEGKLPDIDDKRCSFEVGLFQDTLIDFLPKVTKDKRLVIHIDADLYSSTLYVLTTLAPLIKPGDVLIFDELHVYLDEFRAFEDVLSLLPKQYTALSAMAGFDDIGYSRVAVEFG